MERRDEECVSIVEQRTRKEHDKTRNNIPIQTTVRDFLTGWYDAMPKKQECESPRINNGMTSYRPISQDPNFVIGWYNNAMYRDREHTLLKYDNALITQDNPDFTVERCNVIPEIKNSEVKEF